MPLSDAAHQAAIHRAPADQREAMEHAQPVLRPRAMAHFPPGRQVHLTPALDDGEVLMSYQHMFIGTRVDDITYAGRTARHMVRKTLIERNPIVLRNLEHPGPAPSQQGDKGPALYEKLAAKSRGDLADLIGGNR